MGLGYVALICEWPHPISFIPGPVLMTVGPWKPIALEFYESRIVELDIRSQISEALDVKLTAMLTFSDSETTSNYASFVLRKPDSSVEASVSKIPISGGHASIDLEWRPGQLQLWYPVRYGSQPLYVVEVELADQVRIVTLWNIKLTSMLLLEWKDLGQEN
jgi:beta-mannosidase